MGQLLPFSFICDNLYLYFRDIEFNHHSHSQHNNQINIKKEYPYILFLNQKHRKLLPKIREIMEEQCRSIAVLTYIELDYQVPSIKNQYGEYRSYAYDFFAHKHRYYVIYCRLEVDQIFLKLAVPEFTELSIYDPDYEHWHKPKVEEYQVRCPQKGEANYLEHERQRLENTLKKFR